MKLNESTDYALRIMVLLAKSCCMLSSSEISDREQLSQRYLFRITSKLRDANLLRVTKGPFGGYTLARAPSDISLYEIICVMEGAIEIPDHANCPGSENAISTVYKFFKDFLSGYLNAISLDLLAAHDSRALKMATTDYVAIEKSNLFR